MKFDEIDKVREFVLNTVKDGMEFGHAWEVAKNFQDLPGVFVVAMLHDIVEDGYKTVDELKQIFDLTEIQVEALVAITRNKDENYLFYIRRCSLNQMAKKIKLADIEHNLSRCCNDLKTRWPQAERYIMAYKILLGVSI